MEENRGGDRKSEQRENGNGSPKMDAIERITPKLTAKQIAEDTGQKVTAVKQQISKHRKELSAEQNTKREDEEDQKLSKKIKSIPHTFDTKNGKDRTNSKQNKITHAGCMRLLKECTKRVENVDDETLAQVYKKAVGLMKLLDKE
jgi:Sec-independent protein translocase protein TatA